ncbi:MAG: hypothetical protein ABH817_02160 [archaeon]
MFKATSLIDKEPFRRANIRLQHAEVLTPKSEWEIGETYPLDQAYQEEHAIRKKQRVDTLVISPSVNSSGDLSYQHGVILYKPARWR